MIFHKSQSIFLHIPKTGGTSIEKALFKKIPDPYTFDSHLMFGLVDLQYSQHFNIANISKYSPVNIDKYFIFTFVRNTWDRLVSAYRYLYQKQEFGPFIKSRCEELQHNRLSQTDHFNTQMVFIKNDAGCVVPNFIGYFDNLQKDFDEVCDKIGVSKTILPQINKSYNSKPYQKYYDNYLSGLVKETYKEEIEFFDFKAPQL